MSGKGTGSTSFEDMSHEQMLSWLDQADAGTVRAAAHRLTAAAKEIRKIAEELKIRPQWVEWKGEGADAFRTWTGDLANATLRLGDFGADSATWLGHASDAIAQAQVSIPRDRAGARANLDAAAAAHNDPDAETVSHRSTTELAALAADKEKVRQEAAAQMTKLGQAYRWSATQLDGLERPRFPPPPKAIQPEPGQLTHSEAVPIGGNRVRSSTGGGAAGVSPSDGSHRAMAEAVAGHGRGDAGPDVGEPARWLLSDSSDSVGVHIDGAGVQQTPSAPSAGAASPPNAIRADGGGALPTGPVPPVARDVPRLAANAQGRGRTEAGGRSSVLPGRGQAGSSSSGVPGTGGTAGPVGSAGTARPVIGGRPAVVPSRGTAGAVPGRVPGFSNGIVGGRPTSPAAGSPAGRPAGGLPRGNVVGGEGRGPAAGGRGPTAQRTPPGTGRAGIGRTAAPADRRSTGADAISGVVGGRPQQQRPGTRPLASGGPGSARNRRVAEGQRLSDTDGRPGGEQEPEQRNDGPTT
ncbi:translation initiation factor IF-2 [Streptomyces sp. me109]|uniref:translation initiation factor IF-2 n=1 Tax=Streptomyces sp. me109 TaxID=1827853 RepID=UPI0011CE63E6|nr:translation initiation factor IF-2 [Streptomyces sp. me109]TXS72719.1 translation initiation factor IF-2 [Streptomyces sp. me109]